MGNILDWVNLQNPVTRRRDRESYVMRGWRPKNSLTSTSPQKQGLRANYIRDVALVVPENTNEVNYYGRIFAHCRSYTISTSRALIGKVEISLTTPYLGDIIPALMQHQSCRIVPCVANVRLDEGVDDKL